MIIGTAIKEKTDLSITKPCENQKRTFNAIQDMKHRIQGLAGYVQNDFGSLLDDGLITKEDIKATIVEMDKEYDEVVVELNKLREQTRAIMECYGE